MRQQFEPGLSDPDFLAHGGEMGARIRRFAWSTTALGPLDHWPQHLKTLVGVMLGAKQPMFLAWASGRTLIYNDAYASVLANKHPALGRDFLDVWDEIRSDLEPLVERAYRGEPSHMDDIELVMHRKGYPERTHWAYSYTPVHGPSGAVDGFFCPCHEITRQVAAERRQAFLVELGEALRGTERPQAVMAAAVELLGRRLGANRVGYGEVQADDATVVLHSCYANGVEPLEGSYRLDSFGPRSIALQRQGITQSSPDVTLDPDQDPAVWAAIRTRAFASVPLVREGRFTASLYVNFRDPHMWSAEELALIEDAAARTWAEVERTRAEAARRESEVRFRGVFDSAVAGFSVFDANTGETLAINDRFLAMTGHSRADFEAGRWDWRDFTPDDHIEEDRRAVAQAQQRGWWPAYEKTYRRLDGTVFPVRIASAPLPGEPGRVVVSVEDISERRAADAALRESEERLRRAHAAGRLGDFTWDVATDAITLSGDYPRMLGVAPSSLPKTAAAFLAFIHPDDRERVEAEAAPMLAGGPERFETEYRLIRGDGEIIWLAASAEGEGRLLDGRAARIVGVNFDVTERRRSAARLAESEARFRNMADHAPVMTWVTAPSGACTYLNRRWYEFTGQNAEQAEGFGWLDAVHPDDRGWSGEIFLAANAKREAFRLEYRLRRADGAYRWAIDAASPRFGEDGEFLGFVGSVIDIDDRRDVEDRLRESEERLRLATEAAEVGFWDVDLVNDVLIWPPRVKAMFGISPDAPVSMADFHAALHPDDRERTSAALAAACDPDLRALYDVEYRTVGREDGVLRWVAAKGRGVFDNAGRCVRVLGTAIDVTGRKRTEAALRDLNQTLEKRVVERTAALEESQRRFRGIFDSALQFMALLTPSGTVVEVNETALSWSRIKPEDIVGKPFWLAAPMRGNPELQGAIRAGIERAAAGATVREEHEMRGAGETRAVVDFSLKPVPGEDGAPVWLVAEGRDITELKQAQDALRQAQKLEAVGQLTGGVAHDFNNLLTIIRTSTDLLRKPGLAEDRRRRYVDAISETVDRASKLTGQLLAFARRQALKPEVFDPAHRIRSITEMLRTIVGSRVEIAIDVACERCFIEADASQFETALVNMAVNARDAMDGDGRLSIRVDAVSQLPSLRGHAGGPGRFVAVSLTDTGHGIPVDQIGKIFEPFFTTKEVGKGTGLGLSQVFGFAKQSGGDVAVESEVGRGTTLTLYLPRFAGDETRIGAGKEQRAQAVEEDGRGRRVLVVEDNVEVGQFSTQILQDLGYETTWASNAEEALKLLEGPGGFDAVFSDVVMPGMSGVELGQEIRRRSPGLPVVLTSGYSHVLAEEGRHGFELIKKPYAAEELSRVLRRATRASAPRR